MNKALQKWANRKVETLKRWSKEYDELCKAEGIKENTIITIALDRDYIRSMYASELKDGKMEVLIESKGYFFNNRKKS